MSAPVKLAIDPFFDGSPRSTVATAARPRTTNACQDGDYKSAASEVLGDQRSMAAVIGYGPRGVGAGTVIPHATPGGVPQGVNPNKLGNLQIVIDPHMPGLSSQIRLGDMTDALVQQALHAADEQAPEHEELLAKMSQDDARKERPRLHASAAFHAASSLINRSPAAGHPGARTIAEAPEELPQPTSVAFQESVAEPVPGVVTRSRTAGPLAAFGTPRAAAPPSMPPPTWTAATPQVATTTAVGPPTKAVLFELEHLGEVLAHFPHVLIKVNEQGTGQMILIYDQRYQHGPKWFPPAPKPDVAPENAPRLGASPVGDSNCYLVVPTGFEYVSDEREHHIFMVTRTAPVAD